MAVFSMLNMNMPPHPSQSNMEKTVQYAFNGTAGAAAAGRYAHAVRTFGVAGPWSNNSAGGAQPLPQWDTKHKGSWEGPSPSTILHFSAVFWMYGRRLLDAHPGVPLGLIASHVGGTNIQAWSPNAAITACRRNLTHYDPKEYQCPPYCNTSSLYNGMIAPLTQFTIHHLVWYQGESNCGDALYNCSQRAMVDAWRSAWRQSSLPFGFVQVM